MECIHLKTIDIIGVKTLNHTSLESPSCLICNNGASLWICLTCGLLHCGRKAINTCNENKEYGLIRRRSTRKRKVVFDESLQKCYEPPRMNKKPSKTSKISKVLKKKVKKTSGIRNLGNTCFMNVVLQSLSNIEPFSLYIKDLPAIDHNSNVKIDAMNKRKTRNIQPGETVYVIDELRKTLLELTGPDSSAVSPAALFTLIWKVVPKFRGYHQQDAHEFMRYLLDRLHTELQSLIEDSSYNDCKDVDDKVISTVISSLFGGILQNEVNCLTCGFESFKHDPFLDLSLDIPSRFIGKRTSTTSQSSNSSRCSDKVCQLKDCLSSFTDIEQLEDSELYMCRSCESLRKSTKKFWIRDLPNVLCLHLKRFRYSSGYRLKINNFIEFPLSGLTMSKYVLKNKSTKGSQKSLNLYDLAAVIVHHGDGAGSGHYTCYAVNKGQWFHFNDTNVTSCTEETVRKCHAYILFYVKCQS